jgi:Ser/Thr protein kinase RdoA (MazF antagonist)
VSASSFFALDPEAVLHATEKAGFYPTGEFSQLNSYENRVFDLRLEDPNQPRVIAKFYRPGRWDLATILEEHSFLQELQAEGIPAVAPLIQKNGKTVSEVDGLYVTFFPKVLGRMPDELFKEDLLQIGRMLARIHNVGAQKKFKHRPLLGDTPWTPWESLELLSRWVAPEVWHRYEAAAVEVIEQLETLLQPQNYIRIHGDCHRGNLLSDKDFFFVDFDDSMMGPEIQDFWMLLQGTEEEEQKAILQGYEELRDFPDEQWELVPWLRGLRVISYSAWIARRWEDPSFPLLFPQFTSYTFWAEETEALEAIAWTLQK